MRQMYSLHSFRSSFLARLQPTTRLDHEHTHVMQVFQVDVEYYMMQLGSKQPILREEAKVSDSTAWSL